MFRIICALVTLTVIAPLAQAQRGGHGGGGGHMAGGFSSRSLPLSPGVMPGSSIGPGTQFLPQPTPRFVPTGRGSGMTVMSRSSLNGGFGGGFGNFNNTRGFGYGGYGYGGYGYGGYGGYGYGGYGGYGGYYDDYGYGPIFIPVFPPQPSIALSGEFTATLTIQLPPGKQMQVNGKDVPDDTPAGYSLTSPYLKQDEKYTFSVDVRWTSGGKTYEAKRSVTLGQRDRGRLLIVSGEEVKE